MFKNYSAMWILTVGFLVVHTMAYPSVGWPLYVQSPREYPEEDYYYAPKMQYYYNSPVKHVPEVYGRIPYPYYYDPYAQFAEEDASHQDERLASLPVGQETWYEAETEPTWRSNDMDDVNTAFLDNLILTQMAQDAQRRRENTRNSQHNPTNFEDRDIEDEDVRELKALAGKPLYHVPKTAPRFEEDDYPADEGFINWNGNKRSPTTTTGAPVTVKPKEGQDEIMVPRPSTHQHHKNENKDSVYEKISQLLETEKHRSDDTQKSTGRRLDKRFVAGDSELELQLKGLKHRIRT